MCNDEQQCDEKAIYRLTCIVNQCLEDSGWDLACYFIIYLVYYHRHFISY